MDDPVPALESNEDETKLITDKEEDNSSNSGVHFGLAGGADVSGRFPGSDYTWWHSLPSSDWQTLRGNFFGTILT